MGYTVQGLVAKVKDRVLSKWLIWLVCREPLHYTQMCIEEREREREREERGWIYLACRQPVVLYIRVRGFINSTINLRLKLNVCLLSSASKPVSRIMSVVFRCVLQRGHSCLYEHKYGAELNMENHYNTCTFNTYMLVWHIS